jgi:hypothetical protein
MNYPGVDYVMNLSHVTSKMCSVVMSVTAELPSEFSVQYVGVLMSFLWAKFDAPNSICSQVIATKLKTEDNFRTAAKLSIY